MAEKDFVVKNGLQVNGGTWVVNSTGVYYGGSARANTTHYFNANVAITSNTANTANNASFLGGVAAASYINTSGNYTLSGNITFSSNITFGNSSSNAVVNSSGLFINGSALQSSGGYYKGNLGTVGDASAKQNLYRLNSNTQSNNVTIAAGENAITIGPITISSGYNLTIEEGGRAVII